MRLVVRMRTAAKAALDGLDLKSVRFHLAGDARTTFTLHLLLSAHVASVKAGDGTSGARAREAELPAGSIAPGGLGRDEGVLPYPSRSFAGYRLLQEYFANKERFLFVDVRGLDRAVQALGLTNTLELSVTFDRRLDSPPMVSRDNLRLHCVPVVNLFAHSADPIRLQHERTQYLVQPSKSGVADRRHLEVYSIDEVYGLVRSDTMEARRYEPFYSFRHVGTANPSEAFYYQPTIVPNTLGGDLRLGTDTYLSFVSGRGEHGFPPDETISIELTCTNRDLPVGLRAGDINQPTDSSPTGVRFRNLTKPTATIAPPLGRALHWRLISHMSLNYVSLTDAAHFKELLRVYDFQSEHDAQRALAQQRMLDGIVSIRTELEERLIRGAPVRGSRVSMELNEDHFIGEGDAYLFAAVIDRFLGLYATVNSFTQLSVRFVRSGQVHDFGPRWGEQLAPAATRAIA
jgi:type VI secretion system protein ImpG